MEGDAVTIVTANVPIRIVYDMMCIILVMKQRPQSFLWGFLCLERKKEFMERTMEQKTQKNEKLISTRKLAVTGMLSAVAFILMYLEIPIPIMPSFVKFDFSDLPALIGAFALVIFLFFYLFLLLESYLISYLGEYLFLYLDLFIRERRQKRMPFLQV